MRQEVTREAAGDSSSEKPYICLLGAHSGAFLREEIRKHFSVAQTSGIDAVNASARALGKTDAFQTVSQHRITPVWFGVKELVIGNALNEAPGVADGYALTFNEHTNPAK